MVLLPPVPGTEGGPTNTEYLLKMIDRANGGATSFGESQYATDQIVDDIAVNRAVDAMFVPGEMFIAHNQNREAFNSSNGIDWDKMTIDDVGSIAFGNGRWVAAG